MMEKNIKGNEEEEEKKTCGSTLRKLYLTFCLNNKSVNSITTQRKP